MLSQLEVVRWIDARSEDGWTEQKDLDVRIAEITTTGYVVRETSEVLCLASSWDTRTEQVCGIMFIPKRCVIKRWLVVDED